MSDIITPGNKHFLALQKWMIESSVGAYLACLDYATARVPCELGAEGDMAATIMLLKSWSEDRADRHTRLLTLYAQNGYIDGSRELLVWRMAPMKLKLDRWMSKHPLTAAMHFAGAEATAVLVNAGILDTSDVKKLLQEVIGAFDPVQATRPHLANSNVEAFQHLMDLALADDAAGRARIAEALMLRQIRECAPTTTHDTALDRRAAPARPNRVV